MNRASDEGPLLLVRACAGRVALSWQSNFRQCNANSLATGSDPEKCQLETDSAVAKGSSTMPLTGIEGSNSKGLGRPPNGTPTWNRVRGKFAELRETGTSTVDKSKVPSFEKVRRTLGCNLQVKHQCGRIRRCCKQ